jgi:glyoxalase family protein
MARTTSGVHGLHHITCIAGPAQENLDFYAGVLGMHLVKKSVNQDDPGTYHLFYADAEGSPGTDLTFFPWAQLAPPRMGHGLAVGISLEVPVGSLDFWGKRLERYGTQPHGIEDRFGDRVLMLTDPHGLALALVEPAKPRVHSTPWDSSPVPGEHQIRGLDGARAWEREAVPTAAFLQDVLGFSHLGEERGWTRYGFKDASGHIDVHETPGERRGMWGRGAVHHLAWRVKDEAHQLEVRAGVLAAGLEPTPIIDRFWFQSVYFREPGGVLFELATDGPGFAVDEDRAHLGESLVLPPWLEPSRGEIEAVLPPLQLTQA